VNQYTTSQEGAGPIKSYTYDSNGNMTSDGSKTYKYDFKDRLVEVRDQGTNALIAQYSYDADDRRGAKILPGATTHYIFDGNEIVEERDIANAVTRQYVWGFGGELLQEKTASATYYAHENAIGSIAALTNASGTVVERYKYEPFGSTTVTLDGSTGNQYRFHGSYFDSETGFYFTPARTYSPPLGRFLQRDPLGIWSDALDLGNGYTFMGNDPLNVHVRDMEIVFVQDRQQDPYDAVEEARTRGADERMLRRVQQGPRRYQDPYDEIEEIRTRRFNEERRRRELEEAARAGICPLPEPPPGWRPPPDEPVPLDPLQGECVRRRPADPAKVAEGNKRQNLDRLRADSMRGRRGSTTAYGQAMQDIVVNVGEDALDDVHWKNWWRFKQAGFADIDVK
jgi:RHS repeat-associated protein